MILHVFDDFTEFAADHEYIPMRELIYQYMRNLILNGRLEAGAHLVEEKLAKELNTSRTPVREALRKLESEGLLKHYHRRGVEVRQITTKDAGDLYDLYALLEGHAATLMVQRASAEDIRKLSRILNELRESLEYGDAEHSMQYHREFHLAIYMASGNKRLEQLLCDYADFIQLFMSYYITDCWIQAYDEHAQLYEAIANRDATLAEGIARNHILQNKEIQKSLHPLSSPYQLSSGNRLT